jgi:hypothetical protein
MPFCKVCYDAGLPVADYTDHFVKDQPGPDGKVVCPTLLNQNCRICKQPGHTSTYCSQYRSRRDDRRDDRTPRYIEREEPRRDDRRRDDRPPRYIEREEPRRDDRREEPRRDDRRDDRRDMSFNRLHEDTDRHEREIRVRDETYQRDQDRQSKPWLQAALANPRRDRREPYAHPHGPRVRIELESRALSSATPAAAAVQQTTSAPVIDVMKVDLHHATNWCDETPEQMADELFMDLANESFITRDDEEILGMSCSGGQQFSGQCD